MATWITLLLAMGFGLLVYFLPGFVSLYGFCRKPLFALCCAPVFSILLVVASGFVLHHAFGATSGLLVYVFALAVGLIIGLVGFAFSRKRNTQLGFSWLDGLEKYYPVYLAVGCALVLYLFVLALDGANSYCDSFDNAFHLSLVRSMFESGIFCTMDTNVFPQLNGTGSFYPSGWHIPTAVIASVFGGAATVAANASNILIVAILFPTSCFIVLAYLSRGFEGRKVFLLAGSVVCLAFAAFPWGFLNWGQIVANLLAFVLVPIACLFLLLALFEKSSKVLFCLGFVVSLAGLAVIQPNAVFTTGIFCLPALLLALDQALRLRGKGLPLRFIAALVLLAGVAAVWVVLYKASFMQSTVQYDWDTAYSVKEALMNAASFSFGVLQRPQWFATIFVVVGVLVAFKNRNRALVACAALLLFTALQYVVDVAGPYSLKHLLTGFWYTDSYRIGAMEVLAAIPLAINGVAWLGRKAASLVQFEKMQGTGKILCSAAFVALLMIPNFFPNYEDTSDMYTTTAFGVVSRQVVYEYNQDCSFGLDEDERRFIDKVETIVGNDVVLNMPLDGSRFLYANDGLNVFFRTSNAWGSSGAFGFTEDEQNHLLWEIDDISTDGAAKQTLKQIGAEYLLILDAYWPEEGTVDDILYQDEFWGAMQSIDENTPGFELVLSEGDMRLYKIIAVDKG